MRAVIQRVTAASVKVGGQIVGEIGKGLLVLVGVEQGDTDSDAKQLVAKTIGLRIFDDDDGKMNLSLLDVGGSLLVVSQFTLLADARKGRRPSFVRAAEPAEGDRLYQYFVQQAREHVAKVETGQFQADMKVELVNDGPVTILLDTKKAF